MYAISCNNTEYYTKQNHNGNAMNSLKLFDVVDKSQDVSAEKSNL